MDDPGWRAALIGLVPMLYAARGRIVFGRLTRDGLITLRRVYLSTVPLQVLLSAAGALIAGTADFPAHVDGRVAALACVGLAALVHLGVWRSGERLDPSSDDALAASYWTRSFVRTVALNACCLAGFVAALLSANPAVVVPGLAACLVGMWWYAPTQRRLEALQATLAARGATRSLTAALVDRPQVRSVRA